MVRLLLPGFPVSLLICLIDKQYHAISLTLCKISFYQANLEKDTV